MLQRVIAARAPLDRMHWVVERCWNGPSRRVTQIGWLEMILGGCACLPLT